MGAAIFAQGFGLSADGGTLWYLVGIVGLLVGLVFALVFLSFLHLWVRCLLTGAGVGLVDMVRMKWIGVKPDAIVDLKIMLVQAGVRNVRVQDMEALYLAQRSAVPRVCRALVSAHNAGIDLCWGDAAAIELAGRDVEEAVKCRVTPKVIDCPDSRKGKETLEGVCKDGIQLRAKARVTVRTKLDYLVGGAMEETIIARVGEGIVKAIGSAESHRDVLANPSLISRAVLNNALDSQTAFEIVSIDIAEIDVGGNIGAKLQADRAATDLKVAQANAEQRRAMAVAQEQEMRARAEENRAAVILAEAEVPRALADALRTGQLGVMDYYNMRNLQADTQMRNAIADADVSDDLITRTRG